MLFGASGDGVAAARAAVAAGGPAPNLGMVPKGGGFLQGPGAPKTLPPWIEESDIDFYGEEFRRTGFRGALNYYRNIDRNWEITGAMAGLQVRCRRSTSRAIATSWSPSPARTSCSRT
jgi:hypothetical protein